MARPVYEHIEFCSSAKTLYGKIASGLWDWLGVHPRGDYVLGSPRRAGVIKMSGALSEVPQGEVGRHGVVVSSPGEPSTKDWKADADAARAHYEKWLAQLRATTEPNIWRVQLWTDTLLREEEYVVINPPTYR